MPSQVELQIWDMIIIQRVNIRHIRHINIHFTLFTIKVIKFKCAYKRSGCCERLRKAIGGVCNKIFRTYQFHFFRTTLPGPANAFITGNPDAPYLVYLRNKMRPFCFAGPWNQTISEDSGDDFFSFAIITTVANPFILSFSAVLMPLILDPTYEHRWLRPSASLSGILYLLQPYPVDKMNAFPDSPILSEAPNSSSIVQSNKSLFDKSSQEDIRST
jgi:hypothetical protein